MGRRGSDALRITGDDQYRTDEPDRFGPAPPRGGFALFRDVDVVGYAYRNQPR
jgi:hypothetical protein